MPESNRDVSDSSSPGPLRYRRAKFVARFPRDRYYTPSHYWLLERAAGIWRIGYTKFAMRMLGEAVEIDFEVETGSSVDVGDVVGWMEGFKAVSDLFSPMAGVFRGGNPDLEETIGSVHVEPYTLGWLFEIEGAPGDDLLDAEGYARELDVTIDGMMGETG